MRLPFVSRVAYDAKDHELRQCYVWLAEYRSTTDHYRSEAAKVLGWYNEANDRLHALASPVLPVMAAPAERESQQPSVITQAIRDESGGDPRLAAHFRKRVRELKAGDSKLSDEEIAQQLRTWSTTLDESPA